MSLIEGSSSAAAGVTLNNVKEDLMVPEDLKESVLKLLFFHTSNKR